MGIFKKITVLVGLLLALVAVNQNFPFHVLSISNVVMAEEKKGSEELAKEEITQLDKEELVEIEQEKRNQTSISLIVLILSLSVSILLMFTLIYVVWRRNVLLNSTGALVPEEWAAFLNENAQKVASLEKEVEAQVKFSERSKENLKALTIETKKFSDIMLEFRDSFDKKDKEIERLKQGYDFKIYKNFLSRVLSLYVSMKEEIEKDVSVSDKKSIQNLMIIFSGFLDEFDIEEFSPKIGDDFSKTGNTVGDSPIVMKTDRPEENLRIAEVIKKGYKLKNTDEEVILIPAQVSIYKFQGENS